jgi:hypothetical protein
MDRSGSRHWSLHCLQSRIQGSFDCDEESCGRPKKSQVAVHRTQVQGRDGIGKCIVWGVTSHMSPLTQKALFGPPGPIRSIFLSQQALRLACKVPSMLFIFHLRFDATRVPANP